MLNMLAVSYEKPPHTAFLAIFATWKGLFHSAGICRSFAVSQLAGRTDCSTTPTTS